MNEWMNEWMDEWMDGWMDEWMNEWLTEWMDEWMSEWVSEWMNEWMNKSKIEWKTNDIIPQLDTQGVVVGSAIVDRAGGYETAQGMQRTLTLTTVLWPTSVFECAVRRRENGTRMVGAALRYVCKGSLFSSLFTDVNCRELDPSFWQRIVTCSEA